MADLLLLEHTYNNWSNCAWYIVFLEDLNLVQKTTSFEDLNEQFIDIKSNLLIMEFAKKFMTEKAEKLNGKAAMLGMFALVGAYYFTGQIVPGIF